MLSSLKKIVKEVYRQLANTPSFARSKPPSCTLHNGQQDQINQQIEKALKSHPERLVILLGPFGSGKTTQIHHFMRTHPHYNYFYKSFVKIESLDFAFLHLTRYLTHMFSLLLIISLSIFFMWDFPGTIPLPFLLIASYFFIKNPGNLLYILHEACDNFFLRKHRVVIIEDFERSSLSFTGQWALLANLWQYKRSYIVSLGYSADKKNEKLKMVEYAMKLGGTVIEIPINNAFNYTLIEQQSVPFPFDLKALSSHLTGGWISLFTPREILMIREQLSMRTQGTLSNLNAEEQQLRFVHIWSDFLIDKLELAHREFAFNEEKKEIKAFSPGNLSPEQRCYLESFATSSMPQLSLKLETNSPKA
jgi:hypothetical protein